MTDHLNHLTEEERNRVYKTTFCGLDECYETYEDREAKWWAERLNASRDKLEMVTEQLRKLQRDVDLLVEQRDRETKRADKAESAIRAERAEAPAQAERDARRADENANELGLLRSDMTAALCEVVDIACASLLTAASGLRMPFVFRDDPARNADFLEAQARSLRSWGEKGNRRPHRDTRQKAATRWAEEAFGTDQVKSLPQRGLRLLEEAAEAAQAAGATLEKARHVVEYVYSRPVGDLYQELGGVGVTLLILADAAGFSADEEEKREVARVLSKPIEHFRQRNEEKNAAGLKADL